MLTIEMDDALGKEAPQTRVPQYKEPSYLLKIMQCPLIIHKVRVLNFLLSIHDQVLH